MKVSPLAFFSDISLSPPSPGDKTADVDRVIKGLEDLGFKDVIVPAAVMRRVPGELRRNNYALRLLLGHVREGLRVLDISRDKAYGMAIDIGSTNLECSIFDLSNSEKIYSCGIENPQVKHGSDVLTRVQHSMLGGYEALHLELLAGINKLIDDVCRHCSVLHEDILALTVAGNTIMSHFFLGLEVNNIPVSPYIPAVNSAVFATGVETGLDVNKDAVVYVFPNSGSYVGGDIISGIVSSGLYLEEAPALFIDVGTNVEITLGSREWIMVGAGAAGPALEGGVAGIGKKAGDGTIYRVRIDPESRKVDMDIMAGGEPSGICGSGLTDLIAEMFGAGIIDQSGRFITPAEHIIERNGEKVYQFYKSEATELSLSENEIKNFIISKAAMFSFLYVFVRSVGLTFSDIRKIYIAGGLGCGINAESAVRIGMLPDIPRERFVTLGNSSLSGAEMVLCNSELTKVVDDVASRITYREMNEDSELMSILQGAMFIPHTDPGMLR